MMEDGVTEMIIDLDGAGIISHSSWNFPIVIVWKKSGDLRLCSDFMGLNAADIFHTSSR